MNLQDHKDLIYKFFDDDLKPLIMNKEEDIVKKCQNMAESKLSLYRWYVRQYENTVRVSAYIPGLNFLCFMVATPEGEDEYDFGANYHGSRHKESR